jgi:hypothetical protein
MLSLNNYCGLIVCAIITTNSVAMFTQPLTKRTYPTFSKRSFTQQTKLNRIPTKREITPFQKSVLCINLAASALDVYACHHFGSSFFLLPILPQLLGMAAATSTHPMKSTLEKDITLHIEHNNETKELIVQINNTQNTIDDLEKNNIERLKFLSLDKKLIELKQTQGTLEQNLIQNTSMIYTKYFTTPNDVTQAINYHETIEHLLTQSNSAHDSNSAINLIFSSFSAFFLMLTQIPHIAAITIPASANFISSAAHYNDDQRILHLNDHIIPLLKIYKKHIAEPKQ